MKVSIMRKEHFNAAHRLHNPKWNEETNKNIFGLCNNPHYHGHNYEIIVKLTGEIDAETGFVFDMKLLSTIIKENIINRFDHKNLNKDVEEFRELNPTTENIAVVIYQILRKLINNAYTIKIILYETERNFVEYPAE
ncbi:MAG: 6-carboxytetrahydropterin synthase [Chitinophagaceae bacterium]|nr:6-carboxytetrahydropterin synthase [Chitinophagaceae bacterium]